MDKLVRSASTGAGVAKHQPRICETLTYDDFLFGDGPTGDAVEVTDSKSTFLRHVGMTRPGPQNNALFKAIMDEARAGRDRLFSSRESLLPDLQHDTTIQAPFHPKQISEPAFLKEMRYIFDHASPRTRAIYEMVRSPLPDLDFWAIRWILARAIEDKPDDEVESDVSTDKELSSAILQKSSLCIGHVSQKTVALPLTPTTSSGMESPPYRPTFLPQSQLSKQEPALSLHPSWSRQMPSPVGSPPPFSLPKSTETLATKVSDGRRAAFVTDETKEKGLALNSSVSRPSRLDTPPVDVCHAEDIGRNQQHAKHDLHHNKRKGEDGGHSSRGPLGQSLGSRYTGDSNLKRKREIAHDLLSRPQQPPVTHKRQLQDPVAQRSGFWADVLNS